MTAHRRTLKTALGLALAAGAIAPGAASARFDQYPVHFVPPVRTHGHDVRTHRHEVMTSIRIEDQIRLVRSGMLPRTDLGPNARVIYLAGGTSTSEPDAQAVKQASSGSLLTGRSG